MKMATVTGRRWLSVDGKRALWIATITCCIMFAFEAAKRSFPPGENIFLSHMITVFFVAILSGVFTFIVLQRIGRLHRKIASTEERYRKLFERSLTNTVTERSGSVATGDVLLDGADAARVAADLLAHSPLRHR